MGIAETVVYLTAGFLFLPAGRDVFAMETAIMPGDEHLIKAMTMTSPKGRTFMWGLWGSNWCFISLLKILTVSGAFDVAVSIDVRLFLAADLVVLYYLISQYSTLLSVKADVTGFTVVFALETAAFAALAFA